MDQPQEKRQRVHIATMEHCQYFVKRKKRYCRMTVKKGNKFCGEHMEVSGEITVHEDKKRVFCPIDNSHTCYESRLEKHLKVCNAKKMIDAKPVYIVDGINRGDVLENPEHVSLSLLEESVVESVIRRVEAAHVDLPEIEELILQHEVLDSEVNNPIYGSNTRKHLIQNSSLLGHINRAGLAREDTCFIEFGAGKGKLTYWLAQMLKTTKNSTIVLVDRSSHRNKKDNKLKNEETSMNTIRIRADIADLALSKIEEIKGIKHKVAIAKHLCGAATDLTIRCLSRLIAEDINTEVSGLVIAFCCHHRCDYASYVGKNYLKMYGFTADEFPILCSIASWATCGTGKNRDALNDPTQEVKLAKRESTGRKVKAILNWGRIQHLKSLGFDSRLYYYTTPEVSLENACVIATRKPAEAQ
ncbi:tRNA:m(4)X modification enzyme TRM13 homolog isoform X1 [Diachasma alloeum]|uniref:tRNA:m(4)X modification enzyme TRM13 homolog isoform X1 n=1 Tax=Diachasma alloeum TaxID=454923 RepID=UPI00073837EB|nr:tRNA:m(4)X modification enzyme TRM13 homolog isoform X1 [Diachasma alloeum]